MDLLIDTGTRIVPDDLLLDLGLDPDFPFTTSPTVPGGMGGGGRRSDLSGPVEHQRDPQVVKG